MSSERPTRVRYRVVGLTILLGVITYMDRVCIATLAPAIMTDLALTTTQMSFVFSAFQWAYAAFEIPTARWADHAGTRTVLARIVIWWSSFTIMTAAAFDYVSLLVIRFLFGAGEAGAWPTVARTFAQWIPYRERGTVQGIFFIGAHLGGGITPLLVLALSHWLSWQMIFVVFGSIGFVWAAVWHCWFRDDPGQHPEVNAAELQYIVAGRHAEAGHGAGWAYWKRLLRHPNMLALCLMYVPNSFAFAFCITWLPRYLREQHGLEGTMLAFMTGLPLVLSVLADATGGFTTDWAVRRFGPRLGRAGVGLGAYAFAGAAMIAATFATHALVAGGLIAIATAASMFMLGSAWGTCQDVGGRHTGVVSATMNTAGQIGSIASPLLVDFLVNQYGDWNLALLMIGGFFLVGAFCWCFIDPRRRIFEEDQPPS